MSSSIRPDEFSKYAPRWVREGTMKPRDGRALPAAPQLAAPHAVEPPWRGPSPFEGDIRHWRTGAPPEPQIAPAASVLVTRAPLGFVEKLFRTAAVVVFAVIAMGALGLLLFPDAPRDALRTNSQSLLAAAETRAAISQREKAPTVKSEARVPDQRPAAAPARVEAAAAESVPAEAAKPAPRVVTPVFVVASAESKPQAQQPLDPRTSPPTQPPQMQQATAQQATVQQAMVQQPPAADAQGGMSLTPQRVHSQRILAPEELDRLINRGEAFLSQGDVAAARLVLLRAAEAGDARAALALGATYDPNVLRKMGVVGVQPDPDQARAWYERAANSGSGDANQRLLALAQLTR